MKHQPRIRPRVLEQTFPICFETHSCRARPKPFADLCSRSGLICDWPKTLCKTSPEAFSVAGKWNNTITKTQNWLYSDIARASLYVKSWIDNGIGEIIGKK